MGKRIRDYLEIRKKEATENAKESLDAERMATTEKISSMGGHDLRGPPSMIKNSLYLIEQKPELLKEHKSKVSSSADYALDCLEELRNTTRAAKLNLMQINLCEIVHSAVDEAQIPPEVEVETKIWDGADSVVLDPVQIRRVLDNLIRNAVESMPKGGKLMVCIEGRYEGLILWVVDTGVGIPEGDTPNLQAILHDEA